MRIGSGVQSVSELFGKRQNNSKTSVNGNEAFPQTSMKVYLKTDDMLFSGGNGTGLSFYIKYAEESTDDNPVVIAKGIDENGKEHVYRGECEGLIHDEMVGTNGFGYDPIFYYPEFKTTLANVSEEKKNSVSHRGVALEKFLKDWSK